MKGFWRIAVASDDQDGKTPNFSLLMKKTNCCWLLSSNQPSYEVMVGITGLRQQRKQSGKAKLPYLHQPGIPEIKNYQEIQVLDVHHQYRGDQAEPPPQEKAPCISARFIRSNTATSQNIFTPDLRIRSFTCLSRSWHHYCFSPHIVCTCLPPQFLHLNTYANLQYL